MFILFLALHHSKSLMYDLCYTNWSFKKKKKLLVFFEASFTVTANDFTGKKRSKSHCFGYHHYYYNHNYIML